MARSCIIDAIYDDMSRFIYRLIFPLCLNKPDSSARIEGGSTYKIDLSIDIIPVKFDSIPGTIYPKHLVGFMTTIYNYLHIQIIFYSQNCISNFLSCFNIVTVRFFSTYTKAINQKKIVYWSISAQVILTFNNSDSANDTATFINV